jgi:hypothetical protein
MTFLHAGLGAAHVRGYWGFALSAVWPVRARILYLMGLIGLWRWLQPPKQSLEELAADEEERRWREKPREKAIDQYYEEGFPSQEAVRGFYLWPL